MQNLDNGNPRSTNFTGEAPAIKLKGFNNSIEYHDTEISTDGGSIFTVDSESGKILSVTYGKETPNQLAHIVQFDAKHYRESFQVPRLPEQLTIYDLAHIDPKGQRMFAVRSIDTRGD